MPDEAPVERSGTPEQEAAATLTPGEAAVTLTPAAADGGSQTRPAAGSQLGAVRVLALAAAAALAVPYAAGIDHVRMNGGEFILQTQGWGITSAMAALTKLGDDTFYIVALPVLVMSIDYTRGVQGFTLFFAAVLLTSILKTLFHGPRPSWIEAEGLTCDFEYGMPSGHSVNAASTYLFAVYCIERSSWWTATPRGCLALAARAVAVLLFCAMGLSRVVVGAHYPHQVTAGLCIGAALFAAAVAAVESSRLRELLTTHVSTAKGGAILGALVGLIGLGLSTVAFAVTAATFEFPPEWAERGAQARNGTCTDEEVDE